MITKTRATIDDLYRVPENGKAELVNGELVLMSPASVGHGRASGKIFLSLMRYEEAIGGGSAIGDNVGFIVNLAHRQSFSPDAAWIPEKVRADDLEFYPGPPAFAVEIRSKEDYSPRAERAMAAKRADYFAAGTEVVWDVDLLGAEVIRVYRAADPETPAVFRRGEIADAEPAVPGWRMSVDELFK